MPIWSCALPSPPAPSAHILKLCRTIFAEMQASPRMAGPILSRSLRAARSLGARDRPVAGDLLLGLIRHEHALRRIDPDPVEAWLQLTRSGAPDLPDPEDPVEACAIALSLPGWLAAEWCARLGVEQTARMAKILAGRAPVFLRKLREAPLELPVPFTEIGPRSLRLDGRCNLLADPAWRSGQIEIQDIGSQQIADAALGAATRIAGHPRPRILDLCAGAGGKSLALAALGANVQAWDVRPSALEELKERADRCGLKIRVGPPKGRYDLVLIDAPCSGTGVLRRHPENRWKLRVPADTQRALLQQAAPLAPRILYATCALTAQENSEAVRTLAEPLWERTLWPEEGGQDGFYMAEINTASFHELT